MARIRLNSAAATSPSQVRLAGRRRLPGVAEPLTLRATKALGYNGTVTLRVAGRLRHIGVGRTHAGTDVLLLIQDLHVRIIHAATGEILRELVIDPTRDYQGTGRPPGPAPKKQ